MWARCRKKEKIFCSSHVDSVYAAAENVNKNQVHHKLRFTSVGVDARFQLEESAK
jgi:hypothetical protein